MSGVRKLIIIVWKCLIKSEVSLNIYIFCLIVCYFISLTFQTFHKLLVMQPSQNCFIGLADFIEGCQIPPPPSSWYFLDVIQGDALWCILRFLEGKIFFHNINTPIGNDLRICRKWLECCQYCQNILWSLGYDKKINITSSPLICFASLFQSEGVFFIIKFWLSTLSNLKLMLKIA